MELFIWLTLVSALFHAFSFTWTRRLLIYSQNRVKVAFYSQYAIGIFATLLLPFVGLGNLLAAPLYPLVMGICVMLGQILYLEAMRRGDASFVVPMMSIKIFGVALLSAVILDEIYGPLVYLGGCGAFLGVFFLNNGTFKGSLSATLLVILASLLFSMADTLIILAIRQGYSAVELAIYIFTIPTLLLAPLSGFIFPGDWKISQPFLGSLLIYAVSHLIGVALLMYAFMLSEQITMVNIIQSVRGVFSVGVVYLMGRLGMVGIEKLTRKQISNRLTGSLVMCFSLALAVLAR